MAKDNEEDPESEFILQELEIYLEEYAVCNYSVWYEEDTFYIQCFLDDPSGVSIEDMIDIMDLMDEIEVRFFSKFDALAEMCLEEGVGEPFFQITFVID